MSSIVALITFLAAMTGVLIWPGKLLVHSLRHMVHDTVTQAVEPFLLNGERTVANYAHDAADAAKSANQAAEAARDAAYAAKNAALETRDIVMTWKDERSG